MKLIFILIFASVITGCATTESQKQFNRGPYTITAEGASESEARDDGFRQAVAQAVGAALRSEHVVKNNEVAQSYILTHSAGYVDSYDVKSKKFLAKNRVSLTMEVYIKPTLVDDYVLKSTDSNFSVEGQNLKASITSFQDEKKRGDELLMSILQDYPHKSFDMKVEPVEFKVDQNRTLYALVSYKLKWSDAYLRSLSQVLKQVSDVDCKFGCNNYARYHLSYKKKDSDWTNTNDVHFFKDDARPKLVYEYLRGRYFPPVYSKLQDLHADVRFVIQVDFFDKNQNRLNTGCYFSPHAKKQDYWGGNQFALDNQPYLEESFRINLKKGNWTSDIYHNLEKISDIKVSIVRPDTCPEL